jgi:hypothetical protein
MKAADKVKREIIAIGIRMVFPSPNNFSPLNIMKATAMIYKDATAALIKGFLVIAILL